MTITTDAEPRARELARVLVEILEWCPNTSISADTTCLSAWAYFEEWIGAILDPLSGKSSEDLDGIEEWRNALTEVCECGLGRHTLKEAESTLRMAEVVDD